MATTEYDLDTFIDNVFAQELRDHGIDWNAELQPLKLRLEDLEEGDGLDRAAGDVNALLMEKIEPRMAVVEKDMVDAMQGMGMAPGDLPSYDFFSNLQEEPAPGSSDSKWWEDAKTLPAFGFPEEDLSGKINIKKQDIREFILKILKNLQEIADRADKEMDDANKTKIAKLITQTGILIIAVKSFIAVAGAAAAFAQPVVTMAALLILVGAPVWAIIAVFVAIVVVLVAIVAVVLYIFQSKQSITFVVNMTDYPLNVKSGWVPWGKLSAYPKDYWSPEYATKKVNKYAFLPGRDYLKLKSGKRVPIVYGSFVIGRGNYGGGTEHALEFQFEEGGNKDFPNGAFYQVLCPKTERNRTACGLRQSGISSAKEFYNKYVNESWPEDISYLNRSNQISRIETTGDEKNGCLFGLMVISDGKVFSP